MTSAEKTDKREQLINAAEELFAEKGFDGTSVRDIAQKADVNLAMISYYFGSKEKLLLVLIEQRFASSSELLEDMVKNTKLSSWEKIEKVIEYYVDKILNGRKFHTIINQEYNTDRSHEIIDLITSIKMKNFTLIRQLIDEGIKKKEFRKIDPEMTMASMMGTINSVINSKNIYCALFKIDRENEAEYLAKMKPRLKDHLRLMIRAHLTTE
ncbi:TetR/AcrR family transcriptional regulator [Pseudobacter ginsenosidimutans]|jgi:AcrR family transcriptional regulator|uniref:TetR family transcriptional regulator n=1 Tax=Pseudobacter ginsenosidimutans TaxID=661488 RepID=A0A4Q7MTQ4_9BACT|nr:TetR family transcriptional regulator [Pseudobacter ginsenosidimutans]QEC41219.1 TetR/AcrR family transcriptional regulator [Pseudobacter ginsenosidimutans]RZS72007.1 TetR family transcriptional regulator [Pseudobacter ginsenosidimutans]